MGWAMRDGKTEGSALFIRILGGTAWPQVEYNCGTGTNSLRETARICGLTAKWSADGWSKHSSNANEAKFGMEVEYLFSGTSTERDNSGRVFPGSVLVCRTRPRKDTNGLRVQETHEHDQSAHRGFETRKQNRMEGSIDRTTHYSYSNSIPTANSPHGDRGPSRTSRQGALRLIHWCRRGRFKAQFYERSERKMCKFRERREEGRRKGGRREEN
jgi:hypothetical protein